MEEILPCWIGRESAACAVGRGNVQFHQKSMDPRRENWRLSSMGWSEVVREVSMDDLIGRPRGDGGRFRPPWLGGVNRNTGKVVLARKVKKIRVRSEYFLRSSFALDKFVRNENITYLH